MKLSDGIQAAYNKRWSMINTFSVTIDLPPKLEEKIKSNLRISQVFGRDTDIHIISFTTPDFTNQSIESYISDKWVIHNGRDELYRFSATFRDSENMLLYKKFFHIYEESKENYFDECKLTITLKKESDWHDQGDSIFFVYEDTMIESISNVSFSNDTENQIAEFSVNFKSASPIVR